MSKRSRIFLRVLDWNMNIRGPLPPKVAAVAAAAIDLLNLKRRALLRPVPAFE
jgi:hypothetical protein